MGWNELIGAQLGDNYHILGEIARGGMSRVYRAHDDADDRDVAVKVMALAGDNSDPRGFSKRFEHEARAVERLDHPNIVRVFATGETDEFVYIIMQLITGGTFRQRLGRPLAISEACAVAIQMAQALDHAHRHNVIHRDVKPANMLFDQQDPQHFLLADFGIAKIIGQKGVTKTGTAVGTPEYMAPEQAKGEEIDPRADIYGLACVLYESLAGRPPFVGPTALSICYQHVHTRPAYIRGFNPEVPRQLALIIEQALAKNPNDRFSDAEAFAIALHPFTEPTGTVLRRSRPLTGPLHDLELRGTPENLGVASGGDGGAMLPPFIAAPPPAEQIAPLDQVRPAAPVLDLSKLPPEVPPSVRPEDMTTRQTQEMTPQATPARPRHTHPINPGLRLKSRPMTAPLEGPTPSAPLDPNGAVYTPVPSPTASSDLANQVTVQSNVPPPSAVAAATPPNGYGPGRPVRHSSPAPRTFSDVLVTPQPQRRVLLILFCLAVAITLFALLILNHVRDSAGGTTSTTAPDATATFTSAPATATVPETATALTNTAALAIPHATLTNTGQDATCAAAKNLTKFAVGDTITVNACVANGYGPGTVRIVVLRSDGTPYTQPVINKNVATSAYAFYTLPAGNYTAEIDWNGQVAQSLPFTVGG